MSLNTDNKISIYAEDAITSATEQHSESTGYVYGDTTWQSLTDRMNGSKEGIAYSINYNTAIRQATFMATVLAEALAERNSESGAYTYSEENGIGTTFLEAQEVDFENHAVNIAKIFNKSNFLMSNEVVTSKILDRNVTTSKIALNAITSNELGNILSTTGVTSISSTSNGMTVQISQTSGVGKLNISISGSNVINSNNEQITSSTSQSYLTGVSSISGYQGLKANSNVYMSGGSMYASNFITSGYVQANYFNATSDIRKKNSINYLQCNDVKDFIESTEIVEFRYNDSKDYTIGIIAQEIENKFINNSNFVSKDNEGYLSIKESKLVYALWEYVKYLNERIKNLEK